MTNIIGEQCEICHKKIIRKTQALVQEYMKLGSQVKRLMHARCYFKELKDSTPPKEE